MGDVINLDVVTTEDIPPEKVLEAAITAGLTQCVIIGTRPDDTVHFAMSTGDVREVNWMLDCAKRMLMDGMIEK